MKEILVGATIIYHPEFYIMHHRRPGLNKGEIGKLGLYGGQFDKKKDSLPEKPTKNVPGALAKDLRNAHKIKELANTARRELEEESGILFEEKDFSNRDTLQVKSESDGVEIDISAYIYWLNLRADFELANFRDYVPMTEKQLILAKAIGQLTTIASAALTKIIGLR